MTTALAAALAVFVASTSPSSVTPVNGSPRSAETEMSQFTPEPRRPIVCTQQYAPVCGRIGTATRTYSNACVARAAGAKVIALGPCAE